LDQNFKEAKDVEKEIFSLGRHATTKETKTSGKKLLFLTKPPEREPKDLENVITLIKNLSNEVVDLKKNVDEGSSKKKPFIPFFKNNNNPPKPPKPLGLTLNMDDFGMDNFFSYHQMNHSKKTFPQRINSMTLVIKQLL
jgi:hypothetical protein